MKIMILGKPIPQQRHRDRKFGGKYDPQSQLKDVIRMIIRSQIKEKPYQGPVKIKIIFEMYIPKGTSKIKREKMLRGEILHTKRPDIDNLVKLIYDILNSVAWIDDSQVFEAYAVKKYSEHPKTIINIEEVVGEK